MTDEELIARLRKFGDLWPDDHAAADRIKALVKERDEALEWLSASQGYIADAVFALDKQEKAEAQIAALTARVERLRGALELIADTDPDEGTAWFHTVANAALTTEEGNG